MIKRTVTLVSLLLALSAPAALADSGTPAPSTAAPTARGDVRQNLDRLHDRLQKVTATFVRRCIDGKADEAKCKAAAQKGVDRLQKLSGRIDDRVASIKSHCSGNPVPKACIRADDVVEKLRKLQDVVQTLAQKLQSYLNGAPSTSTGTTSTADDSTGLESLDQLAADLAAAQAAAGN
jgi:hypothetical protein